MGIPTLFSSIIKNKSYTGILAPVIPKETNCDFLLLDFNGSIYNGYANVLKKIAGKNFNKNQIEELIINEVKKELQELVCDIIQPKKLLYIAFDGPVPMAKMIEQRGRRYKAYFEKMYFKEVKRKMNIPDENESWDSSANICPGSIFMEKLSIALTEMIEARGLNQHSETMEIILSDASVIGEGEQKLNPIIRNLAKSSKNRDDTVFIMSKDADLIQLSVLTHKSNIFILRETQQEQDKNLKEGYESYKCFIMNIDSLRQGWINELSKETTFTEGINPMKILTDYVFLMFFVGTDFVKSLSFMKIKYKQAGFGMLKGIYNDVKKHHVNYLIDYDAMDNSSEPRINNAFLRDILRELSTREGKHMKAEYFETMRQMKGPRDDKRAEEEKEKTPYEILQTRYQHVKMCHPDHPLFDVYRKEFIKIDYTKPISEWKNKFYSYYLGIPVQNTEELNRKKTEMVINYFESLVFNLKYYIKGIPSWTWHYEYRQSPLPSDMLYVIENVMTDLNMIEFEMGKPFTPFEQLMMILPPQNDYLVPEVLRPIMNDPLKGCVQYYPTEFKLDAAAGFKTIYSHPILPEIDVDVLIPIVKGEEEKLNEVDARRNQIKTKPIKFTFK